MRSWMVTVVVAGCVALCGAPAFAFGIGETMGAVAVQGTLSSTASSGVAGSIGAVQSQVGTAVSAHNEALVSALGASAPAPSGSQAKWLTAASAALPPGGEGWATLTGGLGGKEGWRVAEPFGGGAPKAWGTSADAWAQGGLLPD